MSIAVGTVVEGVVSGITRFGAFVELPGGLTGLVHISEVADTFVKDVKDFIKEKDRVKVKVINIDENGKIGLSIKRADPNYDENRRGRRHGRVAASASFEDKLARFLKESDERLQDLKRHTEAKRGGRGARGF
ncbi:MAG: binding domain protein [Moorella sp. (in: firmicutes)]|jgi:S1 RNA binding domain protein|uniref:S1 RNA-binding domain-containing protein n=1 Tax=unclassified Neomoorella TaxID=2676739 RepID=UPI0010FFAFA7|nr:MULTISPECIES: S1 RNA-binding domain-containing protein [unclassified Moorella (in: firmicutes)]MDK2816511.1 binding domain protein [Moorella sp. (in: firmicutes)]MDK2894520.1 binding domain protein [Moorella sp. (in: firmicutes)]GEA14565.1 RNA-binding protein S1 [Moorella sp. E308F]GEA18064.1 RNA-binding protein S1 [Moorella sp. E306M]